MCHKVDHIETETTICYVQSVMIMFNQLLGTYNVVKSGCLGYFFSINDMQSLYADKSKAHLQLIYKTYLHSNTLSEQI